MSMHGPYELYLIRHGIAETRGEAWPDDTKRPLTEEGMARLRKEGRGLARLGVVIDVLLASPLVRTRQTAEIIGASFEPRPHIINVESLAPGGAYAAVLADIEKHAKKARIGLVGHEPGIGELAARLIGSRHPVTFKKGAVCRIDLDTLPANSPGELRWFLTPRVLRTIKK
jgi:phosphohistidine phosphatase